MLCGCRMRSWRVAPRRVVHGAASLLPDVKAWKWINQNGTGLGAMAAIVAASVAAWSLLNTAMDSRELYSTYGHRGAFAFTRQRFFNGPCCPEPGSDAGQ